MQDTTRLLDRVKVVDVSELQKVFDLLRKDLGFDRDAMREIVRRHPSMLEMQASKLKDQISSLRENVLLSPTTRDPIDQQKLRDRAMQHFQDSEETKESREKRQSTFGTTIDWDHTKNISPEARRKHELERAARRAREHEGKFHGLTEQEARDVGRPSPSRTNWDREREKYKDIPRNISLEERRKHELELAARRARQHQGEFQGLTPDQARRVKPSSTHINWREERKKFKNSLQKISADEQHRHNLELASRRARKKEGNFHGISDSSRARSIGERMNHEPKGVAFDVDMKKLPHYMQSTEASRHHYEGDENEESWETNLRSPPLGGSPGSNKKKKSRRRGRPSPESERAVRNKLKAASYVGM